MPSKAKHPAPKEQQEIALLKQQVVALETKLAYLLKDLDARKQFFKL